MQLIRSEIIPSPDRPGQLRLTATVRYDDGGTPPEAFWFEVAEEYGEFLSRSGNPWLACLLPLAVTLGEPIRMALPVDDELVQNARELMRIWRCWYPSLREVEIDAPRIEAPMPSAGRTASLFSAGVDAFFTLLSHEEQFTSATDPLRPIGRPVDDLICVWGLDIPLTAPDEFGRLAQEAHEVGRALGKSCILVTTNLMSTRLHEAGWGMLYHGAALASFGLALEQRVGRILIPSTYSYAQLSPFGSHPLTDPLFSTTRLSVRHDGAGFTRTAKTRFIAQFALPRRSLRVCWDSRGFGNCGKCPKCYRTMTALYLLGVLPQFPTFPSADFDVRRVTKVWMRDHGEVLFWHELIDLAHDKGRADVARLIRGGFARSGYLNTIRGAWDWLRRRRLIGSVMDRLLRPVRAVVVGGTIYDELDQVPGLASRESSS